MKNHGYRLKLFISLLLVISTLALAACESSDSEPSATEATTAAKVGFDTTATTTQTTKKEPDFNYEFPVGLEHLNKVENSKFSFKSVVNTSISYSEYRDFRSCATAEFFVPGLAEGVIPQGMDVWEEKGLLLISGYFKDTSYSPTSVVLAVELTTGNYVGEYYIKNKSGSNHTSHVGGLAVTNKNLFLSNSGNLYRIPLTELTSAGAKGNITIKETIATPTKGSFCNYSEGILWVGDYYLEGDDSYSTPSWRHMTNRAGEEYGAWCVGYKLSGTTENGFTSSQWSSGMSYATPDYVLSIEQCVQGFTVYGDYIATSCSYGRAAKSHVNLYENILDTSSHTTTTLNGKSVPVWFLDSKLDCDSYTTPPMSEALAVYGDSILVLFESGASYYKDNGGMHPTDKVWKMTVK
ncbi:MAG: hypothetical protein IJV72_02590 [Clostridia bacterium]|nr:hypothetical protein [Clostridia bacterium]